MTATARTRSPTSRAPSCSLISRRREAVAIQSRDSFSVASDAYARDRPSYPAELFAWIAAHCDGRREAWDCATGSGQAAAALAQWFERVEATDISPQQIGQCFRAPNIVYSVQPAERTDFADASFDLIAVAQALHWFDFDRFWPEVRRVAKPDAFFCAWGYAWFEGDPALIKGFVEPLLALLEPYWAPNNRILWDGYRDEDIRFPFERIAASPFSIRLDWDIAAILRFIRTWSAYKQAFADQDATAMITQLEEDALRRFAGHGAIPLGLPLAVAAGRIV